MRLTDRERDMLRLLAATPGETVPRQALAGNGGATGERAVDVQVNRLRRKSRAGSCQSAAGADRARDWLPPGDDAMTTLDVGIAALRSSLSALRTAGGRFYDVYDRTSTTLKNVMPKGLYARALLIIIAPMVVLQSVVAYMFMERHYNLVTQRLSAGVVQTSRL